MITKNELIRVVTCHGGWLCGWFTAISQE